MNTPAHAAHIDALYADSAPQWDGVADTADWHDRWTLRQLAAAVDVHACRLAAKGGYDLHADLSDAAAALRDLHETVERLERERTDLLAVNVALSLEVSALRGEVAK
jgi:hypothetical protein